MLTDEQGVKAIVFLQKLVGVDEPEEVALKNWQKMPLQEKTQTETVYKAFRTIIKSKEKQCKLN